jgi:hypothetical protein
MFGFGKSSSGQTKLSQRILTYTIVFAVVITVLVLVLKLGEVLFGVNISKNFEGMTGFRSLYSDGSSFDEGFKEAVENDYVNGDGSMKPVKLPYM